MSTFEEIYKIVEESSHETAFNREECLAIYSILQMGPLDESVRVLEIGVEFGRSTTVFAEVAKERGFKFYAVDAWLGEYSEKAKKHIESQMKKHGWNFELLSVTSREASDILKGEFDIIHIDGDHSYEAVKLDCELWLSRIKDGGLVFFDDFGHDSLPGVYKAVYEYMNQHPEWKFIDRFGNKLGVFKKLK